MTRLARRLLIPLAILLAAAALGTFVLGRTRVSASSPLLENPGIRLSADVKQSLQQEIAQGRLIFSTTCSTCHGGEAQGSRLGVKLRGVGGMAVDLWLTAGWMPLKTPSAQPDIKPSQLTSQQIRDVVAYIVSLTPPIPPNLGIPTVSISGANRALGFDVFSLNCAPCHTITGSGDALAYGVHAPSLHNVSALQVYEAVRTGPQNMPRFGPNDITNQQLLGVVAFVTKDIQHPANIGGLGLGGVGPVAEGFVGLFVGVGVCLLAAYWVGERTDPHAYEDEAHGEQDATHESDDEDASHDRGSEDGPEASEPLAQSAETDEQSAGTDERPGEDTES